MNAILKTLVQSSAWLYDEVEKRQLFDFAIYEALLGDLGSDVMQVALKSFYGDIEDSLVAFQSYSLDSDAVSIARAAHTIRGNAATFGFRHLEELAGLLEARVRYATRSEYDAVVEQMADEFDRGRRQLEFRRA